MPTPQPDSISAALEAWGARFRDAHRDDPAVRQAFDQLVTAGCAAETLFCHLALTSVPGEGITRRQIRTMLRDLQAAAGHLRVFAASRTGPFFDPDGEWAHAHDAILRMAKIIEDCLATHVGQKDEWTSKTVADLSRYVEERTGRPHHGQVDVLATAAQAGLRNSPIATRQRRLRSDGRPDHP